MTSCDYSQGKWVKTQQLPLYSGYSCKRWLSPMWACRMDFERTNFAYEHLRWQPLNCSLPHFDNHRFLQRMKNKTIAFIGDSLGRQQFQSLMCLLTHGKDEFDNVIDVGIEYGFPIYVKFNRTNSSKNPRPSSWAYRFKKTNTTILFYWSSTLCYTQSLQREQQSPSKNITSLDQRKRSYEQANFANEEVALHIDKPTTFLLLNIQNFDTIILNTGAHWNPHKFVKNKWKVHMDGKPLNLNISVSVVMKYYNYTINEVTNWLSKQIDMGKTSAKVFYRTSSPNHFSHGDWNTGGRCDNTNYKYTSYMMHKQNEQSLEDNMLHGSKVKLLNITWLSQLREDAHISKFTLKSKNGSQDCLHWCMPGVPDTWNEILFAKLLYHTND